MTSVVTVGATAAGAVAKVAADGSEPKHAPSHLDGTTFRLAAIAGVSGVGLQIVMDRLHPHQADPNDSIAAFTEYVHADAWTAIHLGQFSGTLLIAFALLVLCRSLTEQVGLPGVFARIGGVATLVLVPVFAVQMAVDGVALKHVVDAWASATGVSKALAFQVADAVRWIEKSLAALFQLLNGVALVATGLALAARGYYRRWLGWIGIAAGAGFVVGGSATAHTGFSMQAGSILLPSLLLLALFVLAASVLMWQRGRAAVGVNQPPVARTASKRSSTHEHSGQPAA